MSRSIVDDDCDGPGLSAGPNLSEVGLWPKPGVWELLCSRGLRRRAPAGTAHAWQSSGERRDEALGYHDAYGAMWYMQCILLDHDAQLHRDRVLLPGASGPGNPSLRQEGSPSLAPAASSGASLERIGVDSSPLGRRPALCHHAASQAISSPTSCASGWTRSSRRGAPRPPWPPRRRRRRSRSCSPEGATPSEWGWSKASPGPGATRRPPRLSPTTRSPDTSTCPRH